jgi:hypothetical protein
MSYQSAYQSSDAGLSGTAVSGNIISSQAGELRIIGRYPERGLPPSGVPFSVDVEVDIYKTFWNSFLGLSCPDAVVAALDPQTRSLLALTRIATSALDGCRGRGKLVFGRGFSPDRHHPVIFELHRGDVGELEAAQAQPLARSKVMTLELGIEQGTQSGVYGTPTQSWYEFSLPYPAGGLKGVNDTLSKVLWLVGIGAGAYFLAPLMPGLRDSIGRLASKTTSNAKTTER